MTRGQNFETMCGQRWMNSYTKRRRRCAAPFLRYLHKIPVGGGGGNQLPPSGYCSVFNLYLTLPCPYQLQRISGSKAVLWPEGSWSYRAPAQGTVAKFRLEIPRQVDDSVPVGIAKIWRLNWFSEVGVGITKGACHVHIFQDGGSHARSLRECIFCSLKRLIAWFPFSTSWCDPYAHWEYVSEVRNRDNI